MEIFANRDNIFGRYITNKTNCKSFTAIVNEAYQQIFIFGGHELMPFAVKCTPKKLKGRNCRNLYFYYAWFSFIFLVVEFKIAGIIHQNTSRHNWNLFITFIYSFYKYNNTHIDIFIAYFLPFNYGIYDIHKLLCCNEWKWRRHY